MKRYMFNIKKEVRNNFIIDAKDEETAKKIYEVICNTTDIIDRLLDKQFNDDVEYDTNFYVVAEYNNDKNYQVDDKAEDKATKK